MFFFFNDNSFENHPVYKNAINTVLINKLYRDGYCDISFLTKSKYTKDDIKAQLKKYDSPVLELYNYSFSEQSLNMYLSDILNKLNSRLYIRDDRDDWFDSFAIVYFVYKSLKNAEDIIKKAYKRWSDDYIVEYDIQFFKDIVYDSSKVDIKFINSLDDYLDFIRHLYLYEDECLFYRGHSNCSYKLIPSLFRKDDWLNNEKKMFLELLTRCPNDFINHNTNIEKLAEMQHYGLPTRLLDVTRNPLIALYFSCEYDSDSRGEVIVFKVPNNQINYLHSKKINILSILPLLTREEQDTLYEYFKNNDKASLKEINAMIDFDLDLYINELETIYSKDILGSALYIPQKNIRRIENQDGAFFIHGLVDDIYGCQAGNVLNRYRYSDNSKRLICIIDKKESILRSLDIFGINKAKVYPEIDDVADYIKNNCNVL